MTDALALVTRPEPACSELAARLEAGGLRALPMPAFRFRAITPEPNFADAWSGAPRRLAVFTSPRSVAFGLAVMAPERLAGADIAAVGPATASALEQRGLTVLTPPAGGYTSEALLAHPSLESGAASGSRPPGAALIFAAPGGRRALRDGLCERGWSVTVAPVYERVLARPGADHARSLAEARLVISLWTSGVAMEGLLAALPPEARMRVLDGVFVVISRRLAAQAGKLGAREVRLADGPDNESLAVQALAVAADP